MRFVVRATEHYLVSEWHFAVVLFIMPYKLALSFEVLDKSLKCVRCFVMIRLILLHNVEPPVILTFKILF